jgi:hypothetical protein
MWISRHRFDEMQKVIDAAIDWAYCPDAGGYQDGPSVEDTCEELDAAVRAYVGSNAESPPFPDHWSRPEMLEAITALQESGEHG